MAEVRRRGRPRIEEPKNIRYIVRLTEQEAEELEYYCLKEGCNVSDYIRKSIKMQLNLSKYR